MTGSFGDILDLGGPLFIAALLAFLRIGAVMALLPVFGEQTVPVRIRLALALAFTAIVAPTISTQVGDIMVRGPSIANAIAEIANGLLLGIALRLAVMALQIAGTIAANMTSLSHVLGGAGVDPQPSIANLLLVAALALASLLGLHVKVAGAIILSYEALPPGTGPGAGAAADWGVSAIAHAFSFAFVLAAPFTIVSLVYNLALGAINRAMPQLMVAFVGAPAITWGALFLLAVSAPLMMAVWSDAFDAVLLDPMGRR